MKPRDRLGINLQRARHEQELTQEEVAERAGLHPKTISHFERGTRGTRMETVIQLATALGVETDVLLEGIHWDADKGRFRCDPAERIAKRKRAKRPKKSSN